MEDFGVLFQETSGNLHVSQLQLQPGLWSGSWTGATAGATHRGAGPAELCGGTAWGCRDVGNMGQNWQRSALHSNFDHIVHIISYLSYHILSYKYM